jgi:hypothetical protein
MVLRLRALALAVVSLLALPAAAAAHAPEPVLTGDVDWLTPRQGVPVQLNASGSYDFDHDALVAFDWDLDGDGSFETSTGTSPLLIHTWTDRTAFDDAHVDLSLRVTDAKGEWQVLTVPLQITDDVNGWFTYAPQIVNPGDAVALSAHTSPRPDAEAPFTYTWDLDGDGSYEHSTGSTAEATYVAPEVPMHRTIGLQVTDSAAHVSRVKRRIEVVPRHPSRDQIPWGAAPANLGLGNGGLPIDAAGTPAPVVTPDNVERIAPDRATTPEEVRPRITGLGANVRGMTVTVSGPPGKRYRVVVLVTAKQARKLGIGRRAIILTRGVVRVGRDGRGRVSMPWTRRAYRHFRKVPRGILRIELRR